MTGLPTLVRKELLEAWRTMRLPVVVGLFLLVGLGSPLLARFLPEIIELATGDLGPIPIPIPTPTAAEAVGQLLKNLGQFGAFTAIVLAMGAIASELERGTAAFVLAHPVSRGALVAAKAIVLGVVLAAGVAVAVMSGWLYTAILFEPGSPTGWLLLGGMAWLALAAWSALTLLASALTGSAPAAAGIGIAALLILSIAAAVPGVDRFTPLGLTTPALALATGRATVADLGMDLWLPVATTTALIAAAVGATVVAFRRREL